MRNLMKDEGLAEGMQLHAFNGREFQITDSWIEAKDFIRIAPKPWVLEFHQPTLGIGSGLSPADAATSPTDETANPLARTDLSAPPPSIAGGQATVEGSFEELQAGWTLLRIDGMQVGSLRSCQDCC